MTRLRTRVRLTAKNWRAIYDALCVSADHRECRAVLRKIGADGMAARDRGVAPVRRGTR